MKVSNMSGYSEAAKLDALISELGERYPITPANARAWLAFTRTVTSSLNIMRCLAIKTLEQGGD